MSGFVVGVSGGVDSAVTASLCARTGLPTLLVSLPIHQPAGHVSRGRKHMETLRENHHNVSVVEIDLSDTFDLMAKTLPGTEGVSNTSLALANVRSRLRMTTLYYFAGMHRQLVAGTGNKIEDFGIGFFTKYGDGGVDLNPLADLLKSQVYSLGEALGVDKEIIAAPPSDGLWDDDRSDQDQIGASYPELEWAMQFTGNPSELNERQAEVLAIYQRLNQINQHKVKPIPVCEIPADLLK